MTFAAAMDVSSELSESLKKTKMKLFLKKGAGFLGSLLGQVQFKWTRDIPTAAISHKELLWNPDFFATLDDETKITVLAHELWHNALAHGLRRGNRCPDIWNIAGDHVINLLLKKHGYFMGGFPYVMDDKYEGWATEDVYDDLIAGGMKPQPDPIGLDVIPAQDDDEIAEGMGKVVAAFATAKVTCKPGEVPGEVGMVIDRYLNPKLPWNTILFNFFNAMVEELYSYARPNRRYDDPIMPGLVGREGLENLMFAADISGSITDQHILRFFSEGKYIHEELQPEMMTFVTFDTEVHDVFRLEREEPYDSFQITGRGGTDLNDLYDFAQKENATALVIFTDLYVDIPPNPGIPIIWVCFDNSGATVPYGDLHHFTE